MFRWLGLFAAGLLASGCATSRDIRTLQVQIDAMRAEQRLVKERLARIDSLAAEDVTDTRRLVVDVRQSLSELETRMDQTDARLDDVDRRLSGVRSTDASPPRVVVPGPMDANQGGTPPAIPAEAEDLYQRAFDALKQEDYGAAIEGFRAFGRQGLGGPQEASASYWIGESFYALQQYDSALTHFQVVLDQYPESDKVPAALFRSGNIFTERGDKAKAYPYYRRLKEEYPQSLEYQQLRRRLEE